MISICIPTYNRLSFLKQCLDSIFKGIENYPYEIIVADGGSTDGTIEYLKSMENVTLIEQGKLTGAIKAANECFKRANGDFVYFPNDDFEIKSNVLIKCCKLMEREKELGIVVPNIQEPRFGNLPGITVKKYGILLGKVYIFRRTVLKEIGYFDESYRTYYIDDDAFLSVMKLGYSTIFSKEFAVIHHRSRDEEINKARAANVNPERIEKDLKYLKQKWKTLEENIEQYLKNHKIENTRSNIYQYICNKIWEKNNLANITPLWLYNTFLQRVVIFKDKKYDKMKDFYLAQKYPDDIIY